MRVSKFHPSTIWRVSFKSGISTISGILSQLCSTIFTITIISDGVYLFSLKSDSHPPKKCVICFNESPLKMMKNTFYFISKTPFVLKIFKFLS